MEELKKKKHIKMDLTSPFTEKHLSSEKKKMYKISRCLGE